MSAWPSVRLTARPPERLFHLVLESRDGRALVPIPKRSTSPRATLTPEVVDSLKRLTPEGRLEKRTSPQVQQRTHAVQQGRRLRSRHSCPRPNFFNTLRI